jgi:hypothetical protein
VSIHNAVFSATEYRQPLGITREGLYKKMERSTV